MSKDGETKGSIKHERVRIWIPVIVAIIGAFGGGAGANYLLLRQGPALETLARPDKFTGTEAQALEDELRLEFHNQLEEIRLSISELHRDLDKLPPRELTDRVLRLELQVDDIHDDLMQHEEKYHD